MSEQPLDPKDEYLTRSMFWYIKNSVLDDDEGEKLFEIVKRVSLFVRLYCAAAPEIFLKIGISRIYNSLSEYPEYHSDEQKCRENLQMETRGTDVQKWESLQLKWGKFGKHTRLIWVDDQDMNKQQIDFWTYLEQLGEKGWEVVDFDGSQSNYGTFVLKRPKE